MTSPGSSGRETWLATGASVRGQSHRMADKANQDSLGWAVSDHRSLTTVAVADGHGSAWSFRSAVGSAFAVDTALAVLPELHAEVAGATAVSGPVPPAERRRIAHAILTGWEAAVDQDLRRRPFESSEIEALAHLRADASAADLATNPRIAYGSTLLAASADERAALLVQLGDGDILAAERDGTVSRQIPRDERMVADATTSLCTSPGADEFRAVVVPADGPLLLLLATDGYANSFADDDGFRQVGTDLLRMLQQHGLAWVTERLPDWLDRATAEGSGDDVTVGLLWRPTPYT